MLHSLLLWCVGSAAALSQATVRPNTDAAIKHSINSLRAARDARETMVDVGQLTRRGTLAAAAMALARAAAVDASGGATAGGARDSARHRCVARRRRTL